MPDNDFLQGAQIGLGIAQAWAQRSARQQELRIQDAYRRMQERQLAAQAEHLATQTKDIQQKAQLAVDERAEFDKAQIGMAADIDLGMSPDQSMIKNLMPAVAKYHPDKVGGLVLDAARIPLIKAQQDAAKALGQEREANVDVNIARKELLQGQLKALESGKQIKPTEFESNVGFINKTLEEAGQEPLSDSEFLDMAEVHMGIKPRASAAGQWFDKAEVNELVKEHGELQKEINTLQTSPPPRTKAQRIQQTQSIAAKLARQVKVNELLDKKRSEVEAMMKGKLRPGDTSAGEEVIVISPDGIEGTLPKANLDKALQRGYKLKQ